MMIVEAAGVEMEHGRFLLKKKSLFFFFIKILIYLLLAASGLSYSRARGLLSFQGASSPVVALGLTSLQHVGS